MLGSFAWLPCDLVKCQRSWVKQNLYEADQLKQINPELNIMMETAAHVEFCSSFAPNCFHGFTLNLQKSWKCPILICLGSLSVTPLSGATKRATLLLIKVDGKTKEAGGSQFPRLNNQPLGGWVNEVSLSHSNAKWTNFTIELNTVGP